MLTPYQSSALRHAGFYGSHQGWRSAHYTTGIVIEPGRRPEDASGPLRLIATDGNLGAFISLNNESCYYLGHIKYFTGKPVLEARTSKARSALKPKQPRKKSKRQTIIDLL